jgi:hypothetical protein
MGSTRAAQVSPAGVLIASRNADCISHLWDRDAVQVAVNGRLYESVNGRIQSR